MTQEQETSSKISNPESIVRLVTKMCDGNLQVLLRHRDSGKVTIRGAFTKIGKFKGDSAILIGKMSDVGLAKLETRMPIRVEVLGMPSQLTFLTVIIDKTKDGIICAMPRSLVSTERRTNSRFRVTPNLTPFMSFDFWKSQQSDPACPPFFNSYSGLSNWISVADISLGGVCLLVRFPSFLNACERQTEVVYGHLHLPMTPPLAMAGHIKWRRRIKNRMEESAEERFALEYRIGFEFATIGEEQMQKIRHFIRQLTVAEAI